MGALHAATLNRLLDAALQLPAERRVGWVEQLGEVNTDGVEPLTAVIDQKLRLRDDVVNDGDIRDQILANAPEAQHGFFAVPKAIE